MRGRDVRERRRLMQICMSDNGWVGHWRKGQKSCLAQSSIYVKSTIRDELEDVDNVDLVVNRNRRTDGQEQGACKQGVWRFERAMSWTGSLCVCFECMSEWMSDE